MPVMPRYGIVSSQGGTSEELLVEVYFITEGRWVGAQRSVETLKGLSTLLGSETDLQSLWKVLLSSFSPSLLQYC